MLILLLVGCAAQPSACVPGETQACLCAGAADGAQVCAASGDEWAECACDAADSESADTDTDTSADADGAALFAANCLSCHGPAGHGTQDGPDLRDEVPEMSDREIREVITGGEDDMPAFSFSTAELDALVAWLRDQFGSESGGDDDEDDR